MRSINSLKVGTRGSQMALAQTNQVIEALKAKFNDLSIETVIITTQGDVNHAPIPSDTVGKAWFTKDIEQALLAGEIDFAVHSLKDVTPDIPEGLKIMPALDRDDPRDVLISKSHLKLTELPAGAIVGTDSLRRKAL